MKTRILILLSVALLAGAVIGYTALQTPREIQLTGIVTTDDIIVSSQIMGRLQELRVREGDAVKKGDLLAVIQPEEMQADMSYYAGSEQQAAAEVTQAESDLENMRLDFQRTEKLYRTGVASKQDYDQARTANDSAAAHLDSLKKQLLAATAQREKAKVMLDYTQIRAPIDGIVDVRAALLGEVVNPGQGIVTLINEDDLWVRADIEETYIDGIHLGDRMKIRLPSGAEREGTVFHRGIDADFATQRDVSRTKRDIKTFEIRLRCDNADRALAVGMTAYVMLPVAKP
jgi:RND family efflux transporter MFP subunit